MLESLNTNNLEYQKLTKDEMTKRGILGRLVGACADIINPTRNGRKYSEKLWENVFDDPIMKERIENGVCYGELGHPADREETDMEKIAVCLAEVPKKGSDGKLRAVFDILNTPNGRILKSLCDYGSTLGISSRGSGDLEVDYDGQESVNPDTYNCEGFDIVLIPAVKDARLQYVTESLDKKRYNKTLREKLTESINKETEDHQKIMKESLDTLGIDLNEEGFRPLHPPYHMSFNHIMISINGMPLISQEKDDWINGGWKSLSVGDKVLYEVYDEDGTLMLECDVVEVTDKYAHLKTTSSDSELDDLNMYLGDNFITRVSVYDPKRSMYLDNTLQLIMDESKNVWDNISTILTESKLSPEEKMDMWHDGLRRENIKACGDAKLDMYRKICQDKGYDEQVDIIENELRNRGLLDSETDDELSYIDGKAYIETVYGPALLGNEFKVSMSDDKSKLHILGNEAGVLFMGELDTELSKLTGDDIDSLDFIDFDNPTDTFTVDRNKPYANEIAELVFQRLQKNESLDECNSQNNETYINEEDKAGDVDTALIDELQEALKLNKKLDEKIVNLQKQVSASNAKEIELNEEIDNLKIKIVKLSDKAKSNMALTEKLSKLERDLQESTEAVQTKKTALRETIDRDAKERKTLQESIESKDNEIAKLQKQLTEANKKVSVTDKDVKALNEQLDTAHKDARQLKEKYSKKLEEKDVLIEKYKKIAKTAVDNYISSKATVLGVSTNEIKNRLPESYSFKDINEVCDNLREYNINMNSLPFTTNKLNEGINVAVKNPDKRTLVTNDDDEISDADMKLAEKFMRK